MHVNRDLDKRNRDLILVDSLKLGIEESQCFGFLGAKGSGTKTVIQMLAGIQIPTSGDVTIEDISLFKHRSKVNGGE